MIRATFDWLFGRRQPDNEFWRLRGNAELRRLRDELSSMGRIRASYDAAQTASSNEMHWANADHRAPNMANEYAIRRKLRSRSRYEVIENNSYLKGIALTKANDFTGSGPSIQIADPDMPEASAERIAKRFTQWAGETRLRHKIWQLRMARFCDGEGFAAATTNRKLDDGVQLDWRVIEADQISNMEFYERLAVDGIRFDENGNPDEYFMLRDHPGDAIHGARGVLDGEWVDARFMLHWFRSDRPWQRGIPETVAALPLCAYLRRYTLAVLAASETAADFAAILESQGLPGLGPWGPNAGKAADYEAFDAFPVDKGMFTVLPRGYKLTQLDAKFPQAENDKFVDTIIREISRALQIPFNIAVGFSGGYNFASGTLDRQIYQSATDADRYHFEDYVLRSVFNAWWAEAVLIPGYLPFGRRERPNVSWRWDRVPEHADPLKVAQAEKVWHEMGQRTDDQIQIERFNRDPAEHRRAVERQTEWRRSLNPAANATAEAVGSNSNAEANGSANGRRLPEDAATNEEIARVAASMIDVEALAEAVADQLRTAA